MSAIAARHGLPLPDYGFEPAGNIADRWRKFGGVWASTTGINGGPVQVMAIITTIGDLGDADGHYVIGASPRGKPPQPARHLQLHGLIADNKLTFVTGRARVTLTWAAEKALQARAANFDGRVSQIELRPVWTPASGLRALAAAPASTPAAAPVPRNVPRRSPPPEAKREPSPLDGGPRGRGGGMGGGGGGRGDVLNSPRFPMCARMASQRGLMGPTPERRQFVRSCVLNG